jgi:hypothetical protein
MGAQLHVVAMDLELFRRAIGDFQLQRNLGEAGIHPIGAGVLPAILAEQSH